VCLFILSSIPCLSSVQFYPNYAILNEICGVLETELWNCSWKREHQKSNSASASVPLPELEPLDPAGDFRLQGSAVLQNSVTFAGNHCHTVSTYKWLLGWVGLTHTESVHSLAYRRSPIQVRYTFGVTSLIETNALPVSQTGKIQRIIFLSYYVRCTHYSSLSIGVTDDKEDPRQCTPETPGICDEHAECTQITPHVCACNPFSSYRCECNQGYTGDGLTCTGELSNAVYIKTSLKCLHFRQLRAFYSFCMDICKLFSQQNVIPYVLRTVWPATPFILNCYKYVISTIKHGRVDGIVWIFFAHSTLFLSSFCILYLCNFVAFRWALDIFGIGC